MTTNSKPGANVKTTVIAGKQVKVASRDAAMAASKKVQVKYARALDNLKNR